MITFTQCAAVIIHWWVSRAAPHLCRNCPFLYWRKLTCQGHSPYWAIPPPTIRCPRCRINLRPQTSLYAAFGLRVSKLRWRSDLWPEVIMPNELLSISLQNAGLNNFYRWSQSLFLLSLFLYKILKNIPVWSRAELTNKSTFEFATERVPFSIRVDLQTTLVFIGCVIIILHMRIFISSAIERPIIIGNVFVVRTIPYKRTTLA